jgi:hypothetical protein
VIAENTLNRRVHRFVRSLSVSNLQISALSPRPTSFPTASTSNLSPRFLPVVAWQNLDTQDCVAGTFQNGNGGTMCILCPSGTYSAIPAQADGKNCTRCLGGKYSVTTGATSNGLCLSCEAGTYAVTGSSRCTICPRGKYANSSTSAGSSAMYCLHCDKGKFWSYAQAVNNSACHECPAGVETTRADTLTVVPIDNHTSRHTHSHTHRFVCIARWPDELCRMQAWHIC